MPHFPVDDKLHSHRKAIRAGLAAVGLWTMCGSWSNDQGSDGFIPDYIAARFSPEYETLAARLVEVRLWEVAEIDGEKGWQFHDWTEGGDGVKRNFTRAEIEQRRRTWAERQAKSRERRAGNPQNVTRDNGVTHAGVTRESQSESRGSHAVPVPVPVPVPKPLNSKPEVVDLGSPLTNEDQSEVDESQLPHAKRRRKRWCDEHATPDDRNCGYCRAEHGDKAYWSKRPLSFRGEK